MFLIVDMWGWYPHWNLHTFIRFRELYSWMNRKLVGILTFQILYFPKFNVVPNVRCRAYVQTTNDDVRTACPKSLFRFAKVMRRVDWSKKQGRHYLVNTKPALYFVHWVNWNTYFLNLENSELKMFVISLYLQFWIKKYSKKINNCIHSPDLYNITNLGVCMQDELHIRYGSTAGRFQVTLNTVKVSAW